MTAVNENTTTYAGSLLSLREEETDVLRFILDETLERWSDESEGQLNNLASDPALDTLDKLLEAAQCLGGLPDLVRGIRRKLG